MRVLIAADKFRGTLTAREAVDAIGSVCEERGFTTERVPLSDGGEGWLEVFGGSNRIARISGPLGDEVDAPWRLEGKRAIIEMAAASGLHLVGGAEGNDALAASTYGTGELIAAALDAGANHIIVGLGGSATTDGGLGALRAILPSRLRGVKLEVACDVRTKFLDAAAEFAPQKGASAAQVALLEGRLSRLVELYRQEHGVEVAEVEGSGAAGGLAGGLYALGATLVPGFDLVAEELALDLACEAADLVITGEGLVDAASFDGKVVGGVLALARSSGTPALVIAGEVDWDAVDGAASLVGSTPVLSLTEGVGSEMAHQQPLEAIAMVLQRHFR